MMLICSIDMFGPEAYKVGEICNPDSKYIWFTYNAAIISEEVRGKLRNRKIRVGDKVYVGLKPFDSNNVLIARDGVIRDIQSDFDDNFYSVIVLLNPFLTRDYSMDFITVKVGNAAKNKLFMYGGKNDKRS